MSNQLHGKKFEDVIKATVFPGSADAARRQTARFDVESRYDRHLSLPTSIKTSKLCKTVALADARAFWGLDEPFRLIVGCWRQKTPRIKSFYEVHEFIIHGSMLDNLRGDLTAQQIEDFHHKLRGFQSGHHEAARIWARAQKTALAHIHTNIILNPKIDSQMQRRLQCSVKMSTLERIVQEHSSLRSQRQNYVLHVENIGALSLPFDIKSEPRA